MKVPSKRTALSYFSSPIRDGYAVVLFILLVLVVLVFVIGRLGALLPRQRDHRRRHGELRLGLGFLERLDVHVNLRRGFVAELFESEVDAVLSKVGQTVELLGG